jgi:single-stranded DNA-binding protein
MANIHTPQSQEALHHAAAFADAAFLCLGCLCVAALAGIAVAALGRRRGLAWTWGLVPVGPAAIVLAALGTIGVPFSIGGPLASLVAGFAISACGWAAHRQLGDRRSGADREIEAARRRRPLDRTRRRVNERPARTAALLNGEIPVGRSRRGELVSVPRGSAESGAHVLVPGATGAGKTTSLAALLVEYVARSRFGAVVIEAKNDGALLLAAEQAASVSGVPFRLISPSGPCGYDPLAEGTVDERSERLVAAQTWGSEDADFYRQAASPFLRLVLRALDGASGPATLPVVAERCDPDELDNLACTLDAPELVEEILRANGTLRADERRAIAGLRARLRNLASSEFARAWLDPERAGVRTVDLGESIKRCEVVYFRLDTDRTGNVGRAIAQMALLDLGAVVSSMMGRGIGTFVAIDEFGALEAPALDRLFTRARAAGFSVALGTQTLADLLAAGPAVRERIGATAAAIICHRIGGQEDAEWVAQAIGTLATWETTTRTNGLGIATAEGTRTRGYRFEVNPSELQRLGTGEAIVARLGDASASRSARVAVVPPWQRLPRRQELVQRDGPRRVDRRITKMTVTMPATLTADPKLVRQGETLVCEMRVAELNGGRSPLFIDVVAFGSQAENCAKYLKKGRHVFIDGRLRFEEWKGKDGKTLHDFSIVADWVTFLPGGTRSDGEEAEMPPEPAGRGEGAGPEPVGTPSSR